jgi:NO-binding membrane sensor protein with MHYT domain
MLKKIAIATAAAALTVGLAAAPATAAPKNAGAACVQAGIGTLKSLGLLEAAAQKQIDYSTLADATAGPIFADLPQGSFLSLGQVVKLHTTNPELFAWCR